MTFLENKKQTAFEQKEGYDILMKQCKKVAIILGFEPQIEYMVGTEESSCFHPKHLGCNDPLSQKIQAEKWLKEQQERFPEGWVIQEGNTVIKREYYPVFYSDWNLMIEALRRLKVNFNRSLSPNIEDIFWTWKLIHATTILMPIKEK